MQQKILFPIAFAVSFLILSYAVFMVIKSRSETTLIRTDMTTQLTPETQESQPSQSASVPEVPVPTLTNQIRLTVSSPVNASTVQSNTITIAGITAAKAEVFVNDVSTIADGNGNFSARITLDEGENQIVIVANDENGNTAEAEITVTYEIPQE